MSENEMIMRGMIQGMEMLGLIFKGNNTQFVYFDIPKTCTITQEELERGSEAWERMFGVKVKVKRLKE